jgi:4-amino-4-deoxy-L-arabinose transferase-like glycosyltransferase
VNPSNPAIVSQAAVRRLPRLALILFCVAYVLPGFLGREPWKLEDVSSFGVMLEMAAGHSGWWQPQVLGVPVNEAGPLPYWLGAVFIKLLPFLPADVAARIPFGGLLALTLACTWYAAYHLARQKSAQPVAFAFGGEAQPVDYARTLADAALLALVACLGLAQLSHETTPDLARLAQLSALLLGAARLAQPEAGPPGRSLLIWTGALVALVLSGAGWMALCVGVGLLLIVALTRQSAIGSEPDLHWPREPLIAASLLLLLVVAAAGVVGLMAWPNVRLPAQASEWTSWGRLLVWFTWPAWPLALWTLWRWRRQLRGAHVALPLWTACACVVNSAINPDFDRALLLALPALAALAAFALPTLSRSVSALIDWFTLIFFTGCALVIWTVWVAMQTGVPAKPAANVARLAPGFVPEFSLGLFAVAAFASVAWIWLVGWRVGAHRQALWKSLVLPAAGATLCWMLLMTLWLPLLDFGRSYGPISRSIAKLVPKDSCVLVDGLSQAQIAALQYHGQLTLVRTGGGTEPPCRGMVVDPASQATLDQRVTLTQWAFRASVSRLNDRKERLLVYQRVAD